MAALLLALVAPALLPTPSCAEFGSGSGSDCSGLTGNTVIYDGTTITYHNASTFQGLPSLPKGTRMETMGPSSSDGFDGFITLGGHLSLTHGASFYNYGVQMKRCMEIFADWVNVDHGGVNVNGQRLAVRFVWVDDRSSKAQTMNATAVALRSSSADFAWAGYSSGMTAYTAKQTYADGYLMMSGGAASTPVFTQNDMSFGLFPPAGVYTATALEAVANSAAAIDAGTSTWRFQNRCGGGNGCKSSIVVGVIQAAAGFTRSQCASAGTNARSYGLTVATGSDGTDLVLEIPKSPTLEEAVAALTTLREAGVNVITSCTYYGTGTKLIDGLFNMTWSPYALMMSATVGTQGYADRVGGAGGFKSEYVLGYSIWHGSQPRRGEFSGLTSAEFVDRFSTRFGGAKPSYHGAAQFGVGISLVKAIELANSLDKDLVAAQLRTLNLPEFYTDISFDANGQLAATMLVLQFQGNYSTQASPEATITAPTASMVNELQFPMPDWAIRVCWSTCSAVTGHCNDDGLCVCDANYQGVNCDERVIIVADNTSSYIIAGVLGPIVLIMILYGMYRGVLFVRQAIRLRIAEEERKVNVCRQAIKAATTLQSTAYLISFNSLKKMDKLMMHEEARKAGLFINIDSYEELVKFSTDNPVIFFSHQWLAWAEPDPDKIQYNQMVAAGEALCDKNGYDTDDLYVFLDILSIPQKNMRQRLCAIETLGAFASIFEHFVIIAPDAVHKDTKVACNKVSYGRRGWCRLEQWGHLSVSGTEGMYFYNGIDNVLEPISKSGDDWFLDSIMVLGGDYTVGTYDSKKELVNTILGLYAMVLNGKDGATKNLYDLIEKNYRAVFPEEYFGDLPEILKKIMIGAETKGTAATSDEIKQVQLLKQSATGLARRVGNTAAQVAPMTKIAFG